MKPIALYSKRAHIYNYTGNAKTTYQAKIIKFLYLYNIPKNR